MEGCYPAKPEYATAKLAVWWDMKDCPVPEGYDATRVRLSLEEAFKSLGYTGPVSITGYVDLKQSSDHLLRGLTSTGVAVVHSVPECISSAMYSDILEWRRRNPPPATMMLISDQVEDVLAWDLARLQQHTLYNLFLAYSVKSHFIPLLLTSAEWFWGSLLGSSTDNKHETTSNSSAMFSCKSCSFNCQSLKNFRKHLSSRKHILEEVGNPEYKALDPVTRTWGKNYPAEGEYMEAPIMVWWDMNSCPIPDSYDPRRVRPSLEGEFKKLGYNGPVSIKAYGDLQQSPDHLLQGLSSTGVALAHSIPQRTRIFFDMMVWQKHNPPPATMMLISDKVEENYARALARTQQMTKYNLFLAYPFRPYKMSVLVTSAEWLWDTLLAVSADTGRQFLRKCSKRGESTGMFYCKSCYCHCQGLDHFMNHLSTKEHALQEGGLYSRMQSNKLNRERRLEIKLFPEGKRVRKRVSKASYLTGFRHIHLLLTREARRTAQKSQTCKNEW